MSKLSDAKEILNALQVPTKQQNGMCCCVLLAMAGLTEELPWSEATNNWIRIHDVIAFANSNYGMTYDTGSTSRSGGRPGNQSIGSLSGRGRRFLLPCDAQNMGRHSPRYTQDTRK